MAIQYYVAASVDGFIAAPGDDLDWLMQFGMDEFQSGFDAFMSRVGAVVMGATTYEWIKAQGDDAWAYGSTPSWVLTSRTLEPIPGADIRSGTDPAALVEAAASAAGDRNVWIVGGGATAAAVADAGRLDELHLTLMPVVLGHGTPLLPATRALGPLQLTSTTAYPSGAIELIYRVSPTA